MLYDRDKFFLLEDFTGFMIEKGCEKVDTEVIIDFMDKLREECDKPYIMALLDDCEIEKFLNKVFITDWKEE